MGCGVSVEPDSHNTSSPEKHSQATKNNNEQTVADKNNIVIKNENDNRSKHDLTKKKQHEGNKENLPPLQVPKPVAFNVVLDNSIDNILSREPPKRLKRLQPIENAPRLTSEQLEEKLRIAEEKRLQEMEKRKLASRKSTSRLKQNLTRAQEFERSQQVHQAEELEEKHKSASKNRAAKLQAADEKRRLREERARQARDRAKQMKFDSEKLDYDVEKDENFNATEEDSWLDGEGPSTKGHLGDRVYSGGRESPHKQAGRPSMEYRGLSASTTDSFDHAFQRTTDLPTETAVIQAGARQHDDFFDE